MKRVRTNLYVKTSIYYQPYITYVNDEYKTYLNDRISILIDENKCKYNYNSQEFGNIILTIGINTFMNKSCEGCFYAEFEVNDVISDEIIINKLQKDTALLEVIYLELNRFIHKVNNVISQIEYPDDRMLNFDAATNTLFVAVNPIHSEEIEYESLKYNNTIIMSEIIDNVKIL